MAIIVFPYSVLIMLLAIFYSTCIPYIIYIRDKTLVKVEDLKESKQAELDAERANREIANDRHSSAQDRDDPVAEQEALNDMLESESRIKLLEKVIRILNDLIQ